VLGWWFPTCAMGFAFLLLSLSGAAHGYLVAWALRVFPSLRRRRRAWIAAAAVLVLATPAARLASRSHVGVALPVLAALMIELIAALIVVIPFFAVHWLTRLVPLRRSRLAPLEKTADDAPVHDDPDDGDDGDDIGLDAGASGAASADAVVGRPVTRRVAIERIAGLSIFGGTTVALGWGMVRGRHAYVVEEVPVRIAGLPRALDGYTIAQISDLHAGLFVTEREFREGLSRVAEVGADLVVATGDLVDFDPSFVPMMAGALASVRARDGVTAILGNHDWYTGADHVLAGLRAARIRVLENEGVHIRAADGGGFALLGVNDFMAPRLGEEGPSLERALAMVRPDLPRILLAHQPRFFDDAAGSVALQLSGHTHGGQINPGFRPADLLMRFVAGRYEQQGSTLYVNRGFGVAGPPSRVGAPPEVTKIVLVAA